MSPYPSYRLKRYLMYRMINNFKRYQRKYLISTLKELRTFSIKKNNQPFYYFHCTDITVDPTYYIN